MADDFESFKVALDEQSSSTKFNNFVQAAEDAINSLDNGNIASAAAIAISKLAGGTNGAVMRTVGTTPTWQSLAATSLVHVLERRTATVDIASSASELNLYNGADATAGFVIPAGAMGTDRMLRLTLIGDYLHNNGAGDTCTIKVKFGGSTFHANPSSFGGVIGAARHPWHLFLTVANLGATNSQMIHGTPSIMEIANAAAPTTGIGSGFSFTPSGNGTGLAIATLGTIDTTAAQTLTVTAQWSVSHANNSFRCRYAVLELV